MTKIPTVRDISALIDTLAPYNTCEDYDNVGMLLGSPDAPVNRVWVALDATLPVVREAETFGAQLLITHHPLFFHARRNLLETDAEANVVCAMVRARMSLISAHTNLDRAHHGVNDALAETLGLADVRGEGYVRAGRLPSPMTLQCLCEHAGRVLHAVPRAYGKPDAMISVLAVAGGAADEEYEEAIALGADAYLTGEVRHHNALAAAARSFPLVECGHFETEAVVVPALCNYLQNAFHEVQYQTAVASSRLDPFGRA